MPIEPPARDYFVWSARGGHGATTVAGALARLWRARLESADDGEHEWAFGPRVRGPWAGGISVTDAGVLRSSQGSPSTNIVVLRGPSTAGLRTLSESAARNERLIVIREPWRSITNAAVQDVLGIPVAAEVAFSERISRLADAGLLGARLEKLKEFDQLREWAAGETCRSRLLRRPRQ